jgi:arylsulfatase A-like enzyme
MANKSTRRDFISRTASAAFITAAAPVLANAQADRHPNVLWIVSEDNGPNLGCFGDSYAVTPNLDRLASRGAVYPNVWSSAPVCAPARTAIITGVYPPALGAEHMRSMVRMPPGMRMFPCYLRDAGYYCANNAKEDYNVEKTGQVWDESSRNAHWRNRKPGQPFFTVFNFEETHESQIRKRPHTLVHDPARVRVPDFQPDTPEVRQDWAQYYDKMTEMDSRAGALLRELEEDGLVDDTVIFYYGDNGPGMPRFKRWPYNSGLNVPLIVAIPERYKHLAAPDYRAGGKSDRLISFVDFAPTVLGLAGIRPPDFMRGSAFHGAYQGEAHEYIHGFRGRMDERYDLVRSTRDKRFVYIRNYRPELIYGQYVAYMFQTPTTRIWKRLYDERKLRHPMTYFWEKKPPEELYDLETDPDEAGSVSGAAEFKPVLERFRKAQRQFLLDVRDVGFLPEDEIHSRSAGSTPYEMGHDDSRYPLEAILSAADLASMGDPAATPALTAMLDAKDSAIRWWALEGLMVRGSKAVEPLIDKVRAHLSDPAPSVRVEAAELLARFGGKEDLDESLEALIGLADVSKNSLYVAMAALNAIDHLGEKAATLRKRVVSLPRQSPDVPERLSSYIPDLIDEIATGK